MCLKFMSGELQVIAIQCGEYDRKPIKGFCSMSRQSCDGAVKMQHCRANKLNLGVGEQL